MRVEMPKVVPSVTSIRSPAQIMTELSVTGHEGTRQCHWCSLGTQEALLLLPAFAKGSHNSTACNASFQWTYATTNMHTTKARANAHKILEHRLTNYTESNVPCVTIMRNDRRRRGRRSVRGRTGSTPSEVRAACMLRLFLLPVMPPARKKRWLSFTRTANVPGEEL